MNIKIDQSENLKYIIRFPDGYKNGDRFPVIIFLHGAGSRGNDINILKNNPYFNIINKHLEFPFITVAPQCSQNTWFDMFEQLKRFVFKIYDENFTDKNKIYLMGASMGGYGTWQLAMSLPELFAAIVPICGGGMYWNAARIKIPVWAFHGAKDPTVLCRESEIMVEKVNLRGGNARLTVYPENKHDAWTDTYSNPEVYAWLLSHRRAGSEPAQDSYSKNPGAFG